LVRLYEPTIRRVVRLRLGGTPLQAVFDSMDICQSVLSSFFMRVALGQYTLDSPEQLVKLLSAIARGKLAAQVRRQQAHCRDRRRVAAADVDAGPAAAASPSRQVAARELLQEVQRRLSAEERRLADLRAEGREWTAIAAELGGSAEALRK